MNRETLIDADHPRSGFDLPELWRYRDLFVALTARNIAVRYRSLFSGILWALVHPLSLTVIFTVVLGRLAQLDPGGVPYSVYVFAGLTTWLLFSSTLSGSGGSVLGSRQLISRVYFPRLLIPATAIGSPFVDWTVASVFLAGWCMALGYLPSWQLLVLPIVVLIAAMTAVGVGSLFAGLSLAYRDTRQVLPLLRMLWLFSTPVIWPARLIPEQWQWLLFLNPMAGVVTATRAAWFGLPLDFGALLASALTAALLFWIGLRVYLHFERTFVDDL